MTNLHIKCHTESQRARVGRLLISIGIQPHDPNVLNHYTFNAGWEYIIVKVKYWALTHIVYDEYDEKDVTVIDANGYYETSNQMP